MARALAIRMDEALAAWRRGVNFRARAAKRSHERWRTLGAAIIHGHDVASLRAALEAEGVGAHRALTLAQAFITALTANDMRDRYDAAKIAEREAALSAADARDRLEGVAANAPSSCPTHDAGGTPRRGAPQGRTAARTPDLIRGRNRRPGGGGGQEKSAPEDPQLNWLNRADIGG